MERLQFHRALRPRGRAALSAVRWQRRAQGRGAQLLVPMLGDGMEWDEMVDKFIPGPPKVDFSIVFSKPTCHDTATPL